MWVHADSQPRTLPLDWVVTWGSIKDCGLGVTDHWVTGHYRRHSCTLDGLTPTLGRLSCGMRMFTFIDTLTPDDMERLCTRRALPQGVLSKTLPTAIPFINNVKSAQYAIQIAKLTRRRIAQLNPDGSE